MLIFRKTLLSSLVVSSFVVGTVSSFAMEANQPSAWKQISADVQKYGKAVETLPTKDLMNTPTERQKLKTSFEEIFEKKTVRSTEAGELDRLSLEDKIALKGAFENRRDNAVPSDVMNQTHLQTLIKDLEIGIQNGQYAKEVIKSILAQKDQESRNVFLIASSFILEAAQTNLESCQPAWKQISADVQKYGKAVEDLPTKDLMNMPSERKKLATSFQDIFNKKTVRSKEAGELDRLSLENKIALKGALETRRDNPERLDMMNQSHLQTLIKDLEIGIQNGQYAEEVIKSILAQKDLESNRQSDALSKAKALFK